MTKRSQVALLALTAGLFLAWLGYLTFLVVTQQSPVLSRPQILVTDVVVSAQVDRPDGPITVGEVLGGSPMEGVQEGATLEVTNLGDCKKDESDGKKEESDGKKGGDHPIKEWVGPGRFLVPLTRGGDGRSYRVTAIPRSLGYGGAGPRIYPDTPKARAQLKEILKEFHKS